MKAPYIGVTGFMSKNDVASVVEGYTPKSGRLLMVGVLASLKSVKGIPNKWSRRYPKPEMIASIFPDSEHTLNLVHYATDERETLLEQITYITKTFGGPQFQGFQLNVRWPNIDVLKQYKREFPDKMIVLQCGGGALKQAGNDPVRLAKMIGNYNEVADYALIDPSGGLGKALDIGFSLACLNELASMKLKIGAGIAGGLGPDSVERIKPIVDVHSNISIDAEGQLRDNNDDLSVMRTKAYISKASAMFA